MIRLLARARARMDRRDDDGGFALVYVMLVSVVIMLGVTTTMVSTASNIVPARQSQDTDAALAAANAGVQDAVAWFNSSSGCPRTGSRCDTAVGASYTNTRTGSDLLAGSGESFIWKVLGYVTDAAGNTYLRVSSKGSAGQQSKTLIADVQGVNGILDYEYYSTYETNGSANVTARNPARSVALACNAVAPAAGSNGTLQFTCPAGSTQTASWTGANSGAVNDSVCDKLYYNSSSLNGASANGRAIVESSQGLATGADWRESATVNGATVTRDAPCQVSFTSGETFDGPAYTVDAPLISNGTTSGTGPTFAKGLSTAWSRASSPAAPVTYYRSDPYVGGTLTRNATTRTNPQTLATSFNPAAPSTACIFSGPTRVKLNGDGTATVTSPQTTAAMQTGQAGCYATKNSAGQFTVDYTHYGNGVIYVRNNNRPATGFTTTGQTLGSAPSAADTAFYLQGTAAAQAPDTSSALPTHWSQVGDPNTWTMYSSSKKCGAVSRNTNTPNGPKPWDEQTFQCDWFGHMGDNTFLPPLAPSDGYTAFQNQLTADLSSTSALAVPGNNGNTVTYTNGSSTTSRNIDCSRNQNVLPATATADQLICLVQHDLHQANTGQNEANWNNPPQSGYTHQYIVSNYSQTSTTVNNKTVGLTSSLGLGPDSFFDTTSQSGTASTETQTTTTTTIDVASQVYGCYKGGLVGGVFGGSGSMDLSGSSCSLGLAGQWAWGDGSYPAKSSPQFEITISNTQYSNFQRGTTATAFFPRMADVTQYATGTSGANGDNGPGDVYIEGTNTAPLSVLADGDAVVTGNLTTSGTGSTLLDTLGNIRVYNPVKCVDTALSDVSATSPGFCPNDLTGLYTGGLVTNGTLDSDHPARQYTNLSAAPVTEIDAALVAQGSSSANGSVMADNPDRGSSQGTLTVKGGLYQRHRGTVGVQWEYKSGVARASTGWKLAMAYQDLRSSLPYVPQFVGGSLTRYWNVVSVSSTAGSGS